MARGRKRKYQPSIPAHIDQARLPSGIYWDKTGAGRWFVYDPHPEGGRPVAKTVAGPAARLSDLHVIMEQRAGGDLRGTVGFVIAQFEKSTEFRALSAGTRRDYKYCAKVARGYITKSGATLDTLAVDRLTLPVMQKLNEAIANGREETKPGANDALDPAPAKANHLIRFLRRLFAWGTRFGHCTKNPAEGVKLAPEAGEFSMPEIEAYDAVLKFARERGTLKPHTKGSLPPYLWPVMELAYLCRMRGIEVVKLTDAHATGQGLHVARTKGSNDSIVRWTPRLREAWAGAIAVRAMVLARGPNRGRPVPIRADRRFVIVSESGTPLTKAGLDNAWQDLMLAAIEAKVISSEDRFSLHGLKHRGITDTKGTKRKKKRASGHKTDSALNIYDHDVPVVMPAAHE